MPKASPPGVAQPALAAIRGALAWPAREGGRLYGVAALLSLALALLALWPEPSDAACSPTDPSCWSETLFGIKGDFATGTFMQWLIHIPTPGLTSDGAGAALYAICRDFGFAALGAVLTLSVTHYWAAGLSSQGSRAGIALESVMRTAGAALFILAWPWLIDSAVLLASTLKDGLIPGARLDAINAGVGGGVGASLFATPVIGIIVGVLFAGIALALYVIKVMLSAGLLAIAGGMPLALALWPIPGLSFFANGMLKWCAVIAAVEIAWAVQIYLYGRIGSAEWLSFDGDSGHLLAEIGAPITMIALLAMLLLTPNAILRLGGMGGSHFLSYLGAQLGARAIGQHIPDRLGGQRDTLARQRQMDTDRARDRFAQSGREIIADGRTRLAEQRAGQAGQRAARQGERAAQGMQQKVNPADAEHVIRHANAAADRIRGNRGPADGGRGPGDRPPPGGPGPGGGVPGSGGTPHGPVGGAHPQPGGSGVWTNGANGPTGRVDGDAATSPHVAADGLPQHQGAQSEFDARREEIQAKQSHGLSVDSGGSASPTPGGTPISEVAVWGALDDLHDATPQFVNATMDRAQNAPNASEFTNRMAGAAATRSLPPRSANAFTTIGAADPGIRLDAFSSWSPAPVAAPDPGTSAPSSD